MKSNVMEQIVSYNTQFSAIDSLLLNLDKKKELARILIASGLIPKNLDTAEKVLVCLFKAQEMCIPPLEALSSMPVINGKVTLQGNLILSLINRSHNAKEIRIDSKDNSCEVFMSRKDYEMHFNAIFTLEDAKKAGLTDKQIWRQYPKLMLQWRAVAICARVVFPDLLSGLYTPEEMLSVENIPGQVDQNGDVIPFEKATNPQLINQSGAKRNESENKPSSLALEPQVLANNASEDTSLDNKIPNNTVSIPPSESQQLNTCDNSTVFAPNKTTPDVPLDSMCCGSGSDSEISQIEDLLADGARWNGKIYKGNTIYIASRKFSLSVVDIERLKEICGKLALRQHSHELKSDDRDDLPF